MLLVGRQQQESRGSDAVGAHHHRPGRLEMDGAVAVDPLRAGGASVVVR